jgi:type I restriction enzyme S subunit
MIQLGDKVEINNGYAFKSSKYESEGIRVIRITNVQKGKIRDDNPQYYASSTKGELIKYIIDSGDILMSLTGNVGRVGMFPKELTPAYLNQRVARLRVKSEDLNQKYLFYILNSDEFERDALYNSSGVAQLNLSTKWVAEYKIPLPPLPQQKKIAAILDAADAYRQKTKALISKYNELTQSLFLDMFGDPVTNPKGWEVSNLGDYCVKIQIGPFGSQLHTSDYVDDGIPLINPTNIKKGRINYSTAVKITIDKYNSLSNYQLKIGDIIMARRGDLSKIGIVDRVKSFCGTGSLYLRLKENINSVFGFWLLSHHSTIDKLYEKAQGVTMANLNKKIIINLQLVVPPLNLQNQFAERVQVIEAQKAQAEASFDKADNLFNSLLQKAFKGELL